MENQLYAIIVENPEVKNSSDFIGGREPILVKNIEESKNIIDNHIFDIIESQNPLGNKLIYSVVPWLGNDFGKPVYLYKKDGFLYKEQFIKE